MDAILKKHEEAVVDIENWDDDDLQITGDEFGFRGASFATSHAPSRHRDSTSSRRSFRSDYESNFGDENKELWLPGDDDRSTTDAIAAATRAGVPIPKGVPASALMGGTIKRLGGRKIKKVIEDDWELDMDIPNAKDGGLTFKRQDPSYFPESIRRVSGLDFPRSSPATKTLQPALVFNLNQRSDTQNSVLDRFREEDDNDDWLGDGKDTIKVSKRRQPHKAISLIAPEAPQSQDRRNDLENDPEHGLEFPEGPLTLSSRKDIPKTPAHDLDEFEEWGEGSLGTRFGGTRRDTRSNRSSSISGLSPSVSSTFTFESEDEDVKGLVIPLGPLRFNEILEKRQLERSPDRIPHHQANAKQTAKAPPADDDFLDGLEIGDGNIFNTKSLNRNVKPKPNFMRQTSPVRTKTAVSLTFTNKPSPITSRMSRTNERATISLEPVSESGGPVVNKATKSHARFGHSAQSSVSSTATPTTPSSTQSLPPHISTPHRREIRSKPSVSTLRNEPTTTSAQLLKSKRSMPILRSNNRSPAKPASTRFDRPPTRTDTSSRLMSRPKTPVDRDRSAGESSLSQARKNPLPFLPAGAAQSQSHHVANKSSRYLRRNDSNGSNISTEFRPPSRSFSRTAMRSPSPQRPNLRTIQALAREAALKKTTLEPKKRPNYGDGRELDGFDDLPTSQLVEQKYVKQPTQGRQKTGTQRKRLNQTNTLDRGVTPTLNSAFSPGRNDNLPRFARDTNASRIAREQVLAQRAPSASSPALATITNNWKSQVNARTGTPSQTNTIRAKKNRNAPRQLPSLIKPLHNPVSRVHNGMVYNAQAQRWEGNETDLSPFDIPEAMTPRPALISNINASNGPQISGGMVFHPGHMTWYPLPSSSASIHSEGNDTMDGFDALEDDTFKDIPDLQDTPSIMDADEKSTGTLKDDWLVGEEFDVGPEFVRRQREEEDRWRRKCEKWIGDGGDCLESNGPNSWRWNLRTVVNDGFVGRQGSE